ncbi:MAG TPA: energy-coupling factor transporter ATPase [Bacilli bacterium]|nr:energy-coupling factor transporter ATPase [Bacilli bacterium]
MALKFHHVDFTYAPKSPFQYEALNDISLHIERHSFTAIVGHTGSGKSTLVQHANALLLPTNGIVQVGSKLILPTKQKRYIRHLTKKLKNKKTPDGEKQKINYLLEVLQNYEKYKIKSLRKEVGLVFQFPEYQLFEETVLKDVMFGPRNFDIKTEEAEKLAKEALALVGIDETFYSRSPFELSGGEKRRVAIAGILALQPEVLVLDEPTAGLDPQSAKKMMQTFQKIHEQGTTVILVTHDMNLVLEYANSVIVMENGKIVLKTTPHVLFSDLEQNYHLETPLLYQVMLKLKEQGCPIEVENVKTIDELVVELQRLGVKK